MILALCISYLLIAGAHAQEWARFRGPNGTGVAEGGAIPVSWTEEDYNWKVKLPGLGHSSPVLWGEKVFLLSADPDTATRYVICHSSKDGRELWRRTYESETHDLHLRSSFASSTPAADADHMYVGWSTPTETTLLALDHNGHDVWKLNLGRWVSQHGFGTSPIVYGDMVILHNSQQANQLKEGVEPGESHMMAFDRRTGEERWRTELVSANVCYSVPFIYEPKDGPAELICTSTGVGLFSIDPRDGRMNWSVDAFKMRTVSSPIMAGGLIFGSNGSGRYAGNYIVAVEPGDNAAIRYELKNSGAFKAPYVPCVIADGDKVYLLYDRGFASCIDAPTGEVHWTTRTEAAFNGSPIRVNDRIYCVDEDGVVWVIAANPKRYELLAKNPLGEATRATPAVANGKLFVRTESHLFCIGG
jgi:outer membrane protein assembly factor BamB